MALSVMRSDTHCLDEKDRNGPCIVRTEQHWSPSSGEPSRSCPLSSGACVPGSSSIVSGLALSVSVSLRGCSFCPRRLLFALLLLCALSFSCHFYIFLYFYSLRFRVLPMCVCFFGNSIISIQSISW